MTHYRWMRGPDPGLKAHLVRLLTEFYASVLCGAWPSPRGRWVAAGKTPRCRRCEAMAKRLKVKVRA